VGPILVVSDLTHASDEAVRAAGRLAWASGAALHVIHCAGLVGRPLREVLPLLEAAPVTLLAHRLEAQIRRAAPSCVAERGVAHVEHRSVPGGTLHVADAVDAALVVVGMDGAGAAALPALSAAAGMPVLVARDAAPPPFQRVLVPLDAADVDAGTLRTACAWLRPFQDRRPSVLPEVHVLHVSGRLADWRGIGHRFEADVRAVETDVRGTGGVFHRHVRWSGAAWPAITDASRELDADLVILRPPRGLPTHGRTWSAVVEQARTNVLLLPGAPVPPRAPESVDAADAPGAAGDEDEWILAHAELEPVPA
jgi:nucleotide-binding universal stress UspA family protein